MTKIINGIRTFLNKNIGYDIVKFEGQHNLRAHLTNFLDLYKINKIIDVGANEGQFGRFLRSIGYGGYIYSFEPVLAAFRKLELESAADEKWIVFNFALGSESEEAFINVTMHTSFSSILTPTDYALGHWENSHVDHQQKITVRSLDDLCSEGIISLTGSVFLKMDTQGYDLEVFKGAQRSLQYIKGILSELSLIAVYQDMPNYMQSLSTYHDAGFLVSGFYPITRNKNLSLNEVDCVLVNANNIIN